MMEFIIGVLIALTIIGVFATLNMKDRKKDYKKEEDLKKQRLETLISQENARLEKESKFEKNIQYKKDETKSTTVSTHGGLGNKTTMTFGASNPKPQTRRPQPRPQPRPSQSRSTSSSSSYSGYYDADYDNRNNSYDNHSSNNDSYDSGSDSCGSGGSDD